jgi:polynucleotide 5'-kinase involved in rRNA processing
MKKTDLTQCLIEGKNIWNLAIIDNIDFKEKTFKFEKAYMRHQQV